jgi:hypothetical protein
MNDLLSFHKEELAGEKYNLVHLWTQSLRSVKAGKGSGTNGEWTITDTIQLLCREVREATWRVDSLLQPETEVGDHSRLGLTDAETDVDIVIAKQWRGFRDGYISWHLECRRYQLDFLRPDKFFTDTTENGN